MFRTPPHVPKTFLSLQYLRAAACIVVLYGHGLQQLERFQPGLITSRWEASAVDIFFVLSGFVMWHMTAGEEMSLYEYARRRFVRAIPFYWLVTCAVAALMLLTPHLFNSGKFDGAHLLASLVFIPWPHPVEMGQILPVIVPGWTFEYEIFFYVLLGAALLAPLRSRAFWLIGSMLAITALPLVIHSSSVQFQFYTQPILLEFASGILLGWMVWNNHVPGKWWGLAAFITGCIAIALLPSPIDLVPLIGSSTAMIGRVATYILPAFLIVGGALAFDMGIRGMPRWELPKLIGDASYSIYIVHAMLLAGVTKLWILLDIGQRPGFNIAYFLVSSVLCLGAGVACYFRIEKPLFKSMQNFGKRRVRGTTAQAGTSGINQPA